MYDAMVPMLVCFTYVDVPLYLYCVVGVGNRYTRYVDATNYVVNQSYNFDWNLLDYTIYHPAPVFSPPQQASIRRADGHLSNDRIYERFVCFGSCIRVCNIFGFENSNFKMALHFGILYKGQYTNAYSMFTWIC